ncbi:hypothetical protein ABIB25_005630 [Nakamurella sp. UYEF19]|uniref:hypothetical protein n=1 Tax=Nakamurella sp. UYEF19 TaxID=1756392 RepID=UPI00339AD9FA
MDIEELKEALAARERFTPDEDAVLETVLAHPPKGNVRRSRGRFAVIGIAAAVVLVVATASVVRFTARQASGPPPATAVPSPTQSVLESKLDRTYWSIATVAKGAGGKPISARFDDSFGINFNPDGTVQMTAPLCQTQAVRWTTTDQTVTFDRLTPQKNGCEKQPGAPSPASSILAAAYQAMKAGSTQGHLDGRALVLQPGPYVLTFRLVSTQPSYVYSPSPPSIDGAVQQWKDFPVSARPRPIVLMTSAVVLPADPLPVGEDENALAAGRITLGMTLPTAPETMGGYPIIPPAAAISQLTDPLHSTVVRPSVHITRMQLVDQPFRTDRGDTPLPTWKVTLAESRDPIYVLAVAAGGRYPATLADDPPVGEGATVSGNGKDITISFIAHHVSEGGCDPDYTSSLASKETSTVVVLAVNLHFDSTFPKAGCTDGFSRITSGLYPTPGQPDNTTVHLQEPLGNRALINQSGIPYEVGTS